MTEIKQKMKDSKQGETNTTDILEKIAMIDAMAEVQRIELKPEMKKFDELTMAFLSRIEKELATYSEKSVIFDRYHTEVSLESKTRTKRLSQLPIEGDIYKHVSLKHISMKDHFLSSNKNRSSLTNEFGEAIITK